MLHLTIITILMTGLIMTALSDPLPDSYTYSFFFQVDIYSTIVYSPTQTSVIYSENDTQCFTFRESLQQDQSLEKDICMNESIFAIEYNPQGDRVYVVTNNNDEKVSVYKFYIYEIVEGMINEQGHMAFSRSFDSQLVGYPIVDIAKDKKIAIYLINTLYILKETSNYSIELAFSSQMGNQLVQLQWHPLNMNILFIAGKGFNAVFNMETVGFDQISNLTTIHMNIMYNGSIVLLQAQESDESLSRVYVFSYLAERVTFIEAYTDFVLYKPGLCSVQGNIMGLVKDLGQLHIYNATYQDLIGGTFTFQRLGVIEFVPGISDGSMALDGSEIYLRAYAPVKKITRCPQGMYQAGNSCESCSSQCDTCHFSPTLCTSCNQGYFLSNQKCLSCGSKFRGCNRCSPATCLTCDESANFVFSPFESQCNCKQNYQLDEQSNTCKNKSYAWIIGVIIGGIVLLIIGIGVLVWFIRKKKMSQSNEGYTKFNNEDNSAITNKKESFVKTISSEKSSIEQEPKPTDLIESNNQISEVQVRKPIDGWVEGKADGRIVYEEPRKDGQDGQ